MPRNHKFKKSPNLTKIPWSLINSPKLNLKKSQKRFNVWKIRLVENKFKESLEI